MKAGEKTSNVLFVVCTILEYRRESRPKAYRLCIPPDERRARERRARDPRWGLGARVLPLQL